MLISLKDRQGFNTGLSGVSGTSIQSAFTKPIIDPSYAAFNTSWLPFPYGPLPDTGPWANGDKNEKEEHAAPEAGTGNDKALDKPPWYGEKANNILMFAVVIGAAWFFVFKKR